MRKSNVEPFYGNNCALTFPPVMQSFLLEGRVLLIFIRHEHKYLFSVIADMVLERLQLTFPNECMPASYFYITYHIRSHPLVCERQNKNVVLVLSFTNNKIIWSTM